jgi:hypothetical protein
MSDLDVGHYLGMADMRLFPSNSITLQVDNRLTNKLHGLP